MVKSLHLLTWSTVLPFYPLIVWVMVCSIAWHYPRGCWPWWFTQLLWHHICNRHLQISQGTFSCRWRRKHPCCFYATFPLHLCNTHLLTLNDRARTNNICESWNVSFKKLVGRTHSPVWSLIKALHQDHAIASTLILQDRDGNPSRKRVKRTSQELQTRPRNIYVRLMARRKLVTSSFPVGWKTVMRDHTITLLLSVLNGEAINILATPYWS